MHTGQNHLMAVMSRIWSRELCRFYILRIYNWYFMPYHAILR